MVVSMTVRDILFGTGVRRRFSRYDLLLAVIPLAFVTMTAASALLDIPLETAMVVASVIGALAMVDGMVLRPPSGHGGT